MEQPDKLFSLEQADNIASDPAGMHYTSVEIDLAKQLAATMRENERLESALKIAQALTKRYLSRVNFNDSDDRHIAELREIHYQAAQALEKSNKDSDNA